ncbi:CLUMA_CG009299, isoform A [Clunio marinus]|uniref:CLUMA_CG009299, isoform A n=1 Tax=Clunio marinus TaxID=568069 RepID=A0A1J1I8F5_9DIPT|nr:CLUMA_CG009299, isoform A [Clunio marinus]
MKKLNFCLLKKEKREMRNKEQQTNNYGALKNTLVQLSAYNSFSFSSFCFTETGNFANEKKRKRKRITKQTYAKIACLGCDVQMEPTYMLFIFEIL